MQLKICRPVRLLSVLKGLSTTGTATLQCSSASNPATFSYNLLDYLTVESRPIDGSTTFVKTYDRDEAGRMISLTLSSDENPVREITYSTLGVALEVISHPTENPADDIVNAYTWDAGARMVTETDGAGNTWAYTYNSQGLLDSSTDPLANTATLGYDKEGRLVSNTVPGASSLTVTYLPTGEVTSIYDAAGKYKADGTPLVVLAGKEYGTGSSRDWAAKGVFLLGVRAVLAESYERIHRSNLVGMGVLPLQFKEGQSVESLGLTGHETYTIHVDDDLQPLQDLRVDVTDDQGNSRAVTMTCRVDTPVEVDYYRNGGILQTVLRGFLRD